MLQVLHKDSSSDDILTKKFCCPICSNQINGLQSLNLHLDTVHKLSTTKPSIETISRNNKKEVEKNIFKLKTSHWEIFEAKNSYCKACKKILTNKRQSLNCRKCGGLFCIEDCKYIIKLNKFAYYDSYAGKWCKCCKNCFKNKPYYNDVGAYNDLSDDFKNIRANKNQDQQLRILQLENRLVKLVNGINQIQKECNNSVLGSLTILKEISKLERSIVAWKDDNSSYICPYCNIKFGVLLRKHHCRLCGKLVCNGNGTKCSNMIPLVELLNIRSDLPFKKTLPQISQLNITIRICVQCVRGIFIQNKFYQDIKQPLSPLLYKYENLQNTSNAIISLLSKAETLLIPILKSNENLKQLDIDNFLKLRKKLLETFSFYDKLAKQISYLKLKTNADIRIQAAIKQRTSIFIKEHMSSLKSILSMMHPINSIQLHKEYTLLNRNLTIKEIKEYREQLMVLKEQKYIVENMLETTKKQRQFEEVLILKDNIIELEQKIDELGSKLGDDGFK